MERFIAFEKQLDIEEHIKEIEDSTIKNHNVDAYFESSLVNGNKTSFITKEKLYKEGDSINLICNGKDIAVVKLVFVLPIKIIDGEVFINKDNVRLPLDFVAIKCEGFQTKKRDFFTFYNNGFVGYINFYNYIQHRYLKPNESI